MKARIALVTVLLTGCSEFQLPDRNSSENLDGAFELVEYRDGIARLDSTTGAITLIKEDGIERIAEDGSVVRIQSDLELKRASDRALEENKLATLQSSYSDFPQSEKSLWSHLEFKWRDGKVLYRFSFGPYIEQIHHALAGETSSITIHFQDSDGFSMAKGMVLLGSMTRTMGATDVSRWTYEGEVECSRDRYLQVVNANWGWSYTSEFSKALSEAAPSGKKLIDDQFEAISKLMADGHLKGGASRTSDDYFVYIFGEDGAPVGKSKAEWEALIIEGHFIEQLKTSSTPAPVAQSTTTPPIPLK